MVSLGDQFVMETAMVIFMMNLTNKFARLTALLLVLFAASNPSFADYRFTELAPISGADRSFAAGINNLGQVVGVSYFIPPCAGCAGGARATLWNSGTATELRSFGTSSYALAINDSGQVAGVQSFSYNSYSEAILWNNGPPKVLTTLSGRESSASAINSSGQIAGSSMTRSTTSSATVWSPTSSTAYLGSNSNASDINDAGQVVGNMEGQPVVWNGSIPTALGTLGGGYSQATAINNSGQVVGFSLIAGKNPYHATLWNDTMAIDLGSLGGSSFAQGINDAGQIVGTSDTSDGSTHAFLWDGSAMLDLNSFLDTNSVRDGWILYDAFEINNHGWIVGNARNSITGAQHAFLLEVNAIPEPNTYALVLAGLGLVGFTMRRRKNAKQATANF